MSSHRLHSPSAHQNALSIPATGIAEFVTGLAKKHGVTAMRVYADQWGDAVTRLAGDEVNLDQVQRLLISLRRANKVSSDEMATILFRYLKEKKARVRSV